MAHGVERTVVELLVRRICRYTSTCTSVLALYHVSVATGHINCL